MSKLGDLRWVKVDMSEPVFLFDCKPTKPRKLRLSHQSILFMKFDKEALLDRVKDSKKEMTPEERLDWFRGKMT